VILGLIDEAVAAGARFEAACETLGLAARTVQRWKECPDSDDERVGPKTPARHALTADERDMIIALATSQRYRNLSVRQIVPLLADQGLYVASESSFYRVLHHEDLMAHRSPARPARHAKPKALVATGPRQVWSWDITYLRSARRGEFYYLYLVLDVWSRKIVGWEVHEVECCKLASGVVESACTREGVRTGVLTLHSAAVLALANLGEEELELAIARHQLGEESDDLVVAIKALEQRREHLERRAAQSRGRWLGRAHE
jgi:hypothetical protein